MRSHRRGEGDGAGAALVGGGRGGAAGLHIPACPRAGLRGALRALPRGTLGVVGCCGVRPQPPSEARGRWLHVAAGAEPKGRGAGWRWVTVGDSGLQCCASQGLRAAPRAAGSATWQGGGSCAAASAAPSERRLLSAVVEVKPCSIRLLLFSLFS